MMNLQNYFTQQILPSRRNAYCFFIVFCFPISHLPDEIQTKRNLKLISNIFGFLFSPKTHKNPSQPHPINRTYQLISYSIENIIMHDQVRNNERSLSSLRDLRLEGNKKELMQEEGRRKTRKFCPVKMQIDDSQIYENFSLVQKKKTSTDKALILKSLKSHFTLSSLIEDKLLQDTLLEKFQMCKVNDGEYLMKQNDNASSFFILHEGKLTVEINNETKRTILPGEGFGELALLYSAPRSASIKAVKHSHLWYIDRATFRNAVSTIIEKKFTENREFIDKNSFFTYLTDVQKDKLASIAISQKFEKGSKICKEGELASSIYILKSGKLRKTCEGVKIGDINKGDSFEEYASLKKVSVRRETITVVDDAEVLALGVEDIETVLGRSLPLIILRNHARSALKNSKNFSKLSAENLQKLIDCFQIKRVKEGEIIVGQNVKMKNMIFFMVEGAYDISKDTCRCDLYGDESVQFPDSPYSMSIVMKEDGKMAWTTLDTMTSVLGCSIEESIEKSYEEEKNLSNQKSNLMTLKEEAFKYDLKDFEVLKELGQGQFGTVYLVTNKEKKKFYALKCISKYETLKCKLENHLKNQKEVLETVQSPFMMEYIRSFKDSQYIYFLTQFINGMELFDVIRIIGLLTPSQSRFYGAIMLHALQTLHSNSIMYRDLKPENVMVCENGYLKLIDMGTCKKINPKTARKTFTIIGTPNYMAPEILSGKGYNYSVDLWSLGVVLYEFMAGYVPFGEDAEDPYEIYQEILKNPLSFPKHMRDPVSNSFVSQLLSKNPDSRLGGSYSDLKKHVFFQGFDWHQLINKKMKPCFELPKDKLVNCEKLKASAKPLKSVVKPQKAPVLRKDMKENWDECF